MTSSIVPGYGNRNARIIFVGEAPASTEVRVGQPFQGRAGKQLDELLRDAGIQREDCYLTNASLRPVTGDKGKFFFAGRYPSSVLLEGMKAFSEDLAEIKPNIVVPLGNYALWMLMQHQSIMAWRGSVLWSDMWGVKVMPTIHPAALIRGGAADPGATEGGGGMWKMRPVVVWDLEKALRESQFPELRRIERKILVNPEGEEHDNAVARLVSATRLVVDIESFGGTNLACVGLSDGDPNWAVVWSYDNRPERFALFKSLLERGVAIEGQNFMYDATMLDQIGIHCDRVEYDTMLAAHTLYPEFRKKLEFMTSVYTDIPYYKEERKEENRKPGKEGLIQFYTYCGKDVCATTEIADCQKIELTERKLWPVMKRRMDVFEPLRRATFDGFKCDLQQLYNFAKATNERLDAAQRRLNEIAGREMNVYSHKQIKELVYEKWKLPVRTKKSKVTTDEKALMDISAKSGHEGIGLIIICRKTRKLLSNYYTANVVSSDARIRFGFNVVGTRFGRLSSSAPLWGPGVNIQNIPIQTKYGRDARKIFIADDGMELAEFDQTQAEAIIVAYLADDPVHMDCFRNHKDVHRVTACLLADTDPEQWQSIPKNSVIREIAKKCNHALNYGEGPITFMLNINKEYDPSDDDSLHLDLAESKRIHAKYLQIRPALQNYWDGIASELRSNRTLVSPLGLPYTFLDMWSDSLLRAGYSFKPQSTVGELTNIAIANVKRDSELTRMGVRFKCQVHDSVVFQWPKENRNEIVPRLFPLLETELYLNGYRVVIPWEGKVGQNWYKEEMEPIGVSRKDIEIGYEA